MRAFGEGSGRDEVKQGFSAFLSGFAERQTKVEDVIVEGDRVVAPTILGYFSTSSRATILDVVTINYRVPLTL